LQTRFGMHRADNKMTDSESSSSYRGGHAELYDLFYSEKVYGKETQFIHRYLHENYPGTHDILELACGTGTHALLLEKCGYRITALDNSPGMLECAQKKAHSAGSDIHLYLQDMKNFEIPGTSFDVVLCLFDSLGYVQTNTALTQVLDRVYSHLKPKGLFIFEFWHAAAMLKSFDPVRVRRWVLPDMEIIRISETYLDYSMQTGNVKYTILKLKQDDSYEKIEELQKNRYFSIQEMMSILHQNNFEPLKFFAGFNDDENITDETWHIVAIARRK
jgi:SAM-dependent methyltransferase